MFRLYIAAFIALVGLVVGGVLGVVVDAPVWLSVVAAVLAAVAVPLGAGDALLKVVNMLPPAVKSEIVLYLGVATAALQAVVGAALHVETWVYVAIAVLIAVSTALAQRSEVTSMVDPKDNDGTPLVPLVQTGPPEMPSRPDQA